MQILSIINIFILVIYYKLLPWILQLGRIYPADRLTVAVWQNQT